MNRTSNIKQRFAAAIERLDGDVDLLCEMAAITAPDCPAVLEQIESSLGQGECESAAAPLHKLKGMLSTFDADGVALEIQEMLEHARRGHLQELRQSFDQHQHEIVQLIDEIRGLAGASQQS
ncbi:Hpt domain-containing protein [Stieleria sp. TO1_6]|uniref:Hpt domain-containing protein n=1 Tax=Stieleria tagensis TaxID=2956795 RepID=UPI00209B5A2F|nr:Hpt domain-containing protein [Stieleria tagensis]MCO8120119.1 Hpt domain-containing protein [Stieleria tagensis]